jgi:hypothetical protein
MNMLNLNSEKVILVKKCKFCKVVHNLEVTKAGYEQYEKGADIYQAFPKMTPDDRELLISGMCGPCFDELFADDPEEDEGDDDL